MNTRVNLLPASLQRRRRLRRRRTFWIGLCLLLAGAQAGGAILAGARARQTQLEKERADRLSTALRQEKTERDALKVKAQALATEIRVAERLREKHFWSRWFGHLGLIVPTQVILTDIRTEPARFSENALLVGAGRNPGSPAARPIGTRVLRLSGATIEHQDLINLLEQMNRTAIFRSVRLEQARRDKTQLNETIEFTLVCEW